MSQLAEVQTMPSKDMSQKKDLFPRILVIIVSLVSVSLILYTLVVYYHTGEPAHIWVKSPLEIRSETRADGNWNINITGGQWNIANVRLIIINPISGIKTVNSSISAGETADFIFVNNENSALINFLDSIILKGSSPNIKSGYNVSLEDKGLTIGGPIVLS